MLLRRVSVLFAQDRETSGRTAAALRRHNKGPSALPAALGHLRRITEGAHQYERRGRNSLQVP